MEQKFENLKPAILSFKSKEREKAFWDYFYQINLSHGRMCHVVAVFFFVADGIRDLALFPKGLPGVFFIRFGVIVPLFCLGLVLSYLRAGLYQKIWQPLFALYFFVTGLGAIAITALTPPPVGQGIYTGLIYSLIFGYTFIRLRFVLATAVGLLLTFGYIVTSLWILRLDSNAMWIQFSFVFGVNVLGAVVAYSAEYNSRKTFFLRELNLQQKAQLEAANVNLEDQVKKRTVALEVSNQMLKANQDALHASEMQRNRLELQLRQADKMDAIVTLAGGIAHDFNNVLTGIFGYAQLIQMHLIEPEKIRKYAGEIIKSAERASSLVKQILTFSRHNENEKQLLSLFVLVKETLKLFRGSISPSITIQENIQSRATIQADPAQIHQVIMSLFKNACQAMEADGGVLTVELTEIEIYQGDVQSESHVQPGKYLELKVGDTGHGIDQTIQDRTFDPYFTTRERGRGTGLGLSTVEGIVQDHDGFIKLTSAMGNGSIFQVFLPVAG